MKCFRKFPKGGGLNRLRKFTGQGTCSYIHSEGLLGNMLCLWDSVLSLTLMNSTLLISYLLSEVFLSELNLTGLHTTEFHAAELHIT